MNGKDRVHRLKGSWVGGVIRTNPALRSVMMMGNLHALSIKDDILVSIIADFCSLQFFIPIKI